MELILAKNKAVIPPYDGLRNTPGHESILLIRLYQCDKNNGTLSLIRYIGSIQVPAGITVSLAMTTIPSRTKYSS